MYWWNFSVRDQKSKLQFKAHPGKSLSFVPLQDALLFIVLKAGVHESIYFHEARHMQIRSSHLNKLKAKGHKTNY